MIKDDADPLDILFGAEEISDKEKLRAERYLTADLSLIDQKNEGWIGALLGEIDRTLEDPTFTNPAKIWECHAGDIKRREICCLRVRRESVCAVLHQAEGRTGDISSLFSSVKLAQQRGLLNRHRGREDSLIEVLFGLVEDGSEYFRERGDDWDRAAEADASEN